MPRARPLTPPLRFKFESRAMSTSSTHTVLQTHIYGSIAIYSMHSTSVVAIYHVVARFTSCCLSYILHTITIIHARENSKLAKYQQYIINSNHKSMQLELLYDQTPSSFLDDFRKLVQSHPEVQLAAVQDTSSPSSSQATASDTGSPSSSQATASDTGSPSSSQATAPPPAKKSKKAISLQKIPKKIKCMDHN